MEHEVYQQYFAKLVEDQPPEVIDGVQYPGLYRVTIDGYFLGAFVAWTEEEAIEKFKNKEYTERR